MGKKASSYSVYERIDYMRNTLETGNNFSREEIEKHFEISRPTFFRDIEFMRDRLDMNIKNVNGRYSL